MNVYEIIEKYLNDNGYDGLFNSSAECGCHTCDIMDCDEPKEECEPAYANSCYLCKKKNTCEESYDQLYEGQGTMYMSYKCFEGMDSNA